MFGNLLGAAEQLLGQASTGDVQDAAAQHVGSLPTGDIVNHLLGMIPSLSGGARSELATTVLGALGQNGKPEEAVQAAGVPTDDAKSGDEAALAQLIRHAASDPSSLKDAAVAYITHNPQIVAQYAPTLLQGVLHHLGG